jgi:hypothetical protein
MEEFISTQRMTTGMFIIRRGLVAAKGRVKGAGSVFGEDVILANVPYKYTATTLTFTDTAILDRSDFEMILESFPEAHKMLLKRAKRTSIRERMIIFAKAVKAMGAKLVQDRIAAAERKRARDARAAARARPLLPPLDDESALNLAPLGVVPGTIAERDEGEEWSSSDGDGGDETEDAEREGDFASAGRQTTMAFPLARRNFFDFDDAREFLLPYGGLLNVLMFADERYKVEVERAATKIQALFRGARTRRKLKHDLEHKMVALREQIAEEQLNARMRHKIMAEEGMLTAEEAAAGPAGLRTPAPSAAKGAGKTPALGSGPSSGSLGSVRLLAAAAPALPADVEKMIRSNAEKIDKLAEEQRVILAKVSEMYKIILKGAGPVG